MNLQAGDVDSVRIDRWLSAARIFRSRTQAHDACDAGHVRVNDSRAAPDQAVRAGDSIEARRGDRLFRLEVLALADKRLGPQPARELYEDHSPPPPEQPEQLAPRDEGAGRPTKRDRRALRRLRGR